MSQAVSLEPQDDFADLVRHDRVHGGIYTSQAVFEAEMARIFHRTWVYVGHAAEIPAAGDFRVTRIARQSVIMVRGSDGQVRVLMNRCRHRGVTLTDEETGCVKRFTCPYHGWAYDTQGALLAVPEPDAYGPEMRREDFGMTPAPRVGVYRGFVFASLSASGPTLDEHLGRAKRYIDLFLDVSPTGEIEARAGVHKTCYRANWKFLGMDGYHPNYVHKSVHDVRHRRQRAGGAGPRTVAFSDDAANYTRDLGDGHVMLDVYPVRSAGYPKYRESMAARVPGWDEYYRSMVQAYGQARADEILIWAGDPHIAVFPNLQLLGAQIRLIRPVRPDLTEVLMFPTTLKGVPDGVNRMRLRSHESFYGPASQGSPDDHEIFERNQIGLSADVNPWVYLARGLHRERVDADGSIVGAISDETTQRGQLKQWKALMAQRA